MRGLTAGMAVTLLKADLRRRGQAIEGQKRERVASIAEQKVVQEPPFVS